MNASIGRRHFLGSLLAGAAGLAATRFAVAQDAAAATENAPVEERWLELNNTHTRETVKMVFKRGGDYDTAALEAFKKVAHDHRNGEAHEMDPRLFDQLFDLAHAAQVEPRYEIISGYRSPESNEKMASRPGSGVSKKSLHMQGRAMDVRLKGCSCARLRDLALAAKRGGVGYYEKSDFVHIDTGNFRTWVG
ncbi:MAG TPA: DUF882 domain-containing protein [Steroidobacteraceae bacterium]|nr:DUF882 domain-containing protein [Steroidobacteraceae bacterium]